jgi:hypothetical protein
MTAGAVAHFDMVRLWPLAANPLSVKGLGDFGIVGVAVAIANAIYRPTAKRVRDLPTTLDKLQRWGGPRSAFSGKRLPSYRLANKRGKSSVNRLRYNDCGPLVQMNAVRPAQLGPRVIDA